MKKARPLTLLLILFIFSIPATALCQQSCNLLQVSNAEAAMHANAAGDWCGMMGLSFLTWGLSGLGSYSIYKAGKGA